MSKDTLTTIGKPLTGDEERDAIHIAVAPVTAGAFLKRGEQVMFAPGSKERVIAWDFEIAPLGIVDPFWESSYIPEGTRCWLFLRPGSITSLRHVWEHPAFMMTKQPTTAGETLEFNAQAQLKAQSENWLRAYAERYYGDYDEMLGAAAVGGQCCFGRDLDYEDFDKRGEFWTHVERVLGCVIPDKTREATSFRCAC